MGTTKGFAIFNFLDLDQESPAPKSTSHSINGMRGIHRKVIQRDKTGKTVAKYQMF
jgi:hypothetical protein